MELSIEFGLVNKKYKSFWPVYGGKCVCEYVRKVCVKRAMKKNVNCKVDNLRCKWTINYWKYTYRTDEGRLTIT